MDKDKYIGRLLDNRYEILEVIGTGGMAVVYKARCHRLNRLVAIKILKDDLSQDEEFRRRFHAESQAVAMLSHPNIVSVYDVSTTGEADFIVMELIDGITLKQYMEKKGVLNWKETLHFAIQISKALDHAHSRGIIHRDIKPHNVMVLKNGSVKVADFGIARIMSDSNSLTKEALGSVHYISPEQAKGGRVDNRSDLYSLGVVMYEMMTGRPPYDGESPVAVAIQHINGKAQNPSALNPNIPGGLEQIILRAMAHDPADRYPTAAALLYDMDEFRKDPTILFDYNNPYVDLDAAVRLRPMGEQKKEADPQPVPVPVTPRNKPAGNTDRQVSAARTAAAKSRSGSRRHQEEIIEEEEDRGKSSTTIIVIFALIALLAIIIGIMVIWSSTKNSMVSVPDLKGMTEEEAANLGDLIIKVSEKKYDDTYPAGQIISQMPVSGSQIAKGGQISVVVSLGAVPKDGTMMDLQDVRLEDAKGYLTGLGMDLQFLPKYENSSTIASGNVIRTEPANGEELTKGQTVVLYVSSGPEVRTAKMINVLSLSVDTAQNMLKGAGFSNLSFQPTESSQAQGTVVSQSVDADQVIDVTTEIILYYSTGTGTADIPTDPVEDTVPPSMDSTLSSVVLTFQLPEDMTEDYTLTIWTGTTIVDTIQIVAGTISTQIEVYGTGSATYEARIGTQLVQSIDVVF